MRISMRGSAGTSPAGEQKKGGGEALTGRASAGDGKGSRIPRI